MFFPKLALKGGDAKSPLLRGRFIMPPFSVLDARQGYWQDRKRAWIALGIKSEVGRGDSPRPACNYRDGQRGDGSGKAMDADATASFKNQGAQSALQKGKNGLLGFSEQARSHYKQSSKTAVSSKLAPGGGSECWIGGPITDSTEKYLGAKDFGTEGNVSTQTGTSIFDPVLCEIIYRWFVPKEGTVLDPFAGGSVRGIVANFLGLHYTGIDLSDNQIQANYVQAEKIVPDNKPVWICGDSLQSDTLISRRDQFDFVFSCPPYHDLEVYSTHESDLSSMSYADFVVSYTSIIKKAVHRLRENRFACFVVGEIRDKKTGFYKSFVPDTIAAFEAAGAHYYNEAILVTAVGSLPVRTNNYFKSRKLGKTHQNVLIFYKGDTNKIKENFPWE